MQRRAKSKKPSSNGVDVSAVPSTSSANKVTARTLSKSSPSWWPDGLGGFRNPLQPFGTTAAWVDTSLAPGTTDMTPLLSPRQTLMDIVTLKYFVMSPNLTWLLMCLIVYACQPYDIASAARGWSFDWIVHRIVVNLVLAGVYYSCFHTLLYVRRAGSRKFKPTQWPTAGNMIHNLWYWTLFVVQWSLWECAVMRLWASDAQTYASESDIAFTDLVNQRISLVDFLSNSVLWWNVLWILLVPIWRDIHFYVAHRFIHIRAIYKYVHSLHHRIPDPEPFAG
jgi:sterol desaturase/sphingolipid hydroxylase (fatty acid hydroxylase superfamily)